MTGPVVHGQGCRPRPRVLWSICILPPADGVSAGVVRHSPPMANARQRDFNTLRVELRCHLPAPSHLERNPAGSDGNLTLMRGPSKPDEAVVSAVRDRTIVPRAGSWSADRPGRPSSRRLFRVARFRRRTGAGSWSAADLAGTSWVSIKHSARPRGAGAGRGRHQLVMADPTAPGRAWRRAGTRKRLRPE